MFQLKNKEYTLEQLQKAAEASNMGVDAYIERAKKESGLIDKRKDEPGKTTPPKEDNQGAPAEVNAAPDTDSKPGVTSSGFTKEGEILLTGKPFEEGGWAITSVPLEEVVVTANEYSKKESEVARNVLKDFGIPEIQKKDTGELKSITAFEETQRISKDELEKRQQIPEKPKTLMQSIANSTGQAMNRFAQIDDYGQYLYHMVLSDTDIAYNLFGEDFGNKVLNHNRIELGKQEAKLKKYARLTKPAFGFTDISKNESIGKNIIYGAGGAINAVMNVGSSAVLSAATGGVGLGVEIIGQTIAEHNRILGETKGMNLEQLQKSGMFDIATPLTIGALRYKLEKIGLDKLSKSIMGSSPSVTKNIVDLTFTTGFNGTQEWVDVGLETINKSLAEGKTQQEAEEDAWKFMTSKEGYESFFQGAFGSSGIVLGAKGLRAAASLRSKDDYSSLRKKITKIGDLERAKLKKGLSEESINSISEQQNKLISEIKLDVKKNNKILFSLTESQIKEINSRADVIQQTNKTARAVNEDTSLDNNTKKEILLGLEQRIAEAQTGIFNIRKNAEELTKQTEKVKRAAQYVDNLEIEKFDNEEQINEFLDKQDYLNTENKNKLKKQSSDYGFIIQDPNTDKQIIVINSSQASKTAEGVNVANHEFMHALLFKALKENPAASKKLAIALNEELNKINIDQINNSIYRERLKEYLQDPDVDNFQAAEEALTLFSDALKSGDITLNKDKISDGIRSVMQTFGIKTKFNTGQDVIDFIRDINKSVDKGTLTKEQIRIAQGFDKLEGSIIEKKLPEELTGDKKEQAQGIIRKESRKIPTNKVQKIYDEKGKDAAFEIIEAYKPLTTKLTNKYRDVPGFEFELLQSEIEIGKRGLLDLINAYDPSKGATLNTYVQGQLANRSIEAANRILDTEFKLDVTEAKGVTDTATEEAVEAAEEKPTKELTSLRKKMNIGDEIKPVVFDAVRKTFGTKLPSVTEKAFKKELEKSFRIELKKPISKLFGKGEEYRSFLSNNFESIYNALPQSIFNRRLKEFAEPVLDKDGKQKREKTAEGNKIFTKKKIAKAEFIKYFLGNEVGRSTQGTRKTAIVEAVAEAFAFDATMEVLSNPEVSQKAMDIAELQGIELTDDFVDKVGGIINRPINFKFSKARKALNLQAGSIDFKNKEQVLSGREAMLKLAKILGPEKTVQYLLPTVQGGWGLIGGKFIPEKDIDKLTVKELVDPNDKNSFRTNQFLFIGRADFFEEAKKIFNSVEYKKRKRSVNINGEQISILAVPNQTPRGFTKGKFEGEELQNRLYFAKIQREGLKSIINSIKQLYENNEITKNDVGMILSTFNSSINALIRTAAYPGLQFKVDGLNDSDYRYEHTQTASDTLTELAKFITIKNYKFTFDNIMQGFRIAIIPKTYDKIVNSTGFKSNGPRDNNGDLIKGKSTDVIRYNQKEVIEAFNKENLPPLKLTDALSENLSVKSSKSLNKEFNTILEQSSGIKATKKFSPVEARIAGKGKGKLKLFIPYSADDFVGLLYTTLSGGKTGDQQMDWYRENLLRPFSRGIQQYEAAKQNALREWQILKKEAKKSVPGGLDKKNASGLTNQEAVRLYIWKQQGMEIPGTKGSAAFVNENLKTVRKNPELKAFAERLMALNPEGYPAPSDNWDSGDITTDLVSYIDGVKRSEFLTEFKDNAAKIFSDSNKEKLRALYGDNFIEALDDMLHRMKTGTNRRFGASKIERQFMDWTNNSVGAIMFFNARSAVLQTLSAVNFINFTDNNPINAALALANFPQYVDDFTTLFNSDFLKQRRTGLQTDVNADEIARAAKGAKNTARAMLSAILKFGFTPTQIADSFAIASGGATFYRNRINKYKKEGLSQQEAETKAFTDFQEIAEETQQSARPDRISLQQASSLGRLILAFGNTPMQYARLTKKASLDLINGRGDWKTNMSKIMYYSVIQNIIFSALQQGLFALLFDDEDDDKEKSRLFRIGNSSLDTFLRGSGVYGAAAATAKNMILKIIEESEKSRPDYTKVAIEATAISPPINSKLRKLVSAGKTFTYKQSKEKVFTEGFSLENPAFLAGGQVVSALTNLPADRVVLKADHLKTAIEPETELWQSIALSLGWSEWDLNMIQNQTKKPSKAKSFLKTKKFKTGLKRKKLKTK